MKNPITNPAQAKTGIQNPRSVTVEIGELVLHGFARGDRHEIGEALQRELGELLSNRGIPQSLAGGRDLARLNAATINMPDRGKPAAVGKQVARAVYNQFAGPPSRASNLPKKS
jgi:hypothetical protein